MRLTSSQKLTVKLHHGTKLKLPVLHFLRYRYLYILVWKEEMEWKGHLTKIQGLVKFELLKFIRSPNRNLHNVHRHIFKRNALALYAAYENKQELNTISLRLQNHRSTSIFTEILVYYVFIVPTSKNCIRSFNLIQYFFNSFASLWLCNLKALCKFWNNVLLHSSINLKYIQIRNRESHQKRIWIDALSFFRLKTSQKLKENTNA